jgi:DNA-binding MarR family transcriptional regulator
MDTRDLPSLGTELRRLIDLLDGDLDQHYRSLGLDYRARFTPVVRAIEAIGPASIKTIAKHGGLSHSASSQTVAQMAKSGLVVLEPGTDGRERIVKPTAALIEMMPALHTQWEATAKAASALDEELTVPLSSIVREAIVALHRQSFADRLASETNTSSA